ncbi:MAG: hypothetical protein JEZ03_02070 [Bacteroidales bacterium]|nr:hypothetical protein [Bacteroidales bacterium]
MRKNYMYKVYLLGICVVTSLCLQSCQSSNPNKEFITERIQYDVSIYNNDRQSEWWKNNIEGMNREKLVKSIIDKAFGGDYLLCDAFSYETLSSQDLNQHYNRMDTLLVQSAEPPYGYIEKVVEKQLNFEEITKIRFLEQWTYNEDTFIEKKVLGICPMLESFDEEGEFRGYQPMFWVFFDGHNPLK